MPALTMAVAQPVWGRVDEAQHFDFAAQLAHGRYPLAGVTTLRPETVAIMRATGVYQWAQAGASPPPAVTDAARFTPPPPGLTNPIRQSWLHNHLWWFSYEAMQPPVYYLLATPAWAAGYGLAGGLGALHAVRLLDAAILALVAPLVLVAAWILLPGRPLVGAGAALLAALLPGFALNGSAVTNDGLAAVLGAALFAISAAGATRGWSLRTGAALGALLGLALLTKLTAFGLVPMVVVAFCWPLPAGRPAARRQLAAAAVAAVVAGLLVAPWLLLNQRLYGHPTAQVQAAALLGATFRPQPLSPGFVAASIANAFTSFWSGEPVGTLPAVAALNGAGLALTLAAAVGVQRLLRDREARASHAALLALAGAGAAGSVAWALAASSAAGLGALAPGRYAYAGLAPILLLLVTGASVVLRQARWRLLLAASCASLMILSLTAYALGYSGNPEPAVSWTPAETAGGQVVDSGGSFGPVTIRAEQVTTDAEGRVWLHVTAVNAGSEPAEWWPVPYLMLGPNSYQADYAAGAQLSQALPAGAQVGGWIAFTHIPPAALRSRTVGVKFYGVTLAGYSAQSPILFGLPPLT